MKISVRVKRRQQKCGTRYRGQLYLDGRCARSKDFPTHEEAKQWANDQAAFARVGKTHGIAKRQVSRTLADKCDTYLKSKLSEIALSNQPQRRADVAWWRDRLGHL